MTSENIQPDGLGPTGAELWRTVMDEYVLTAAEQVILTSACRTADSIDDLQARLDADGLMTTTSQGTRVHPALAELRQQRITLARLWSALRVPIGEDDSKPTGRTQRRGPRGVYGLGDAA